MKSLADYRSEPEPRSQLSTRPQPKTASLSISARTLAVVTTLEAVYPSFRIPKDEPARATALAVWDKVITEFCPADVDRVLNMWQQAKGPDFCSSRDFYRSLKALSQAHCGIKNTDMAEDVIEKNYFKQLNKRLDNYHKIIATKKEKNQ